MALRSHFIYAIEKHQYINISSWFVFDILIPYS